MYTWPLLGNVTRRIIADPGDPVLNASILWWNATTLPFTAAWWDAPAFYPASGVSGFTENLVGVSPLASPVLWLTGQPIAAYNVAMFLTWPLSAFAGYVLVTLLSGRKDAGFIAGTAFAFSPYRMMELSHVQMLASFWLPLALAALHAYFADTRRRWLFLFGLAWVLNGLANGHFLLFGSVFVGAWFLFFGSRREGWRRTAVAAAVWLAASLALAPVLLRYQTIHEQYGLFRTEAEILAFSATPRSWFEVSSDTWFWPSWIPEGRDNLFPGVTALTLIAAAAAALLWRVVRHRAGNHAASPRWLRASLAATALLALAATLITLAAGPWSVTFGGVLIRMGDLNRALLLLIVCGVPFLWLTPAIHDAISRRSPLVFYSAMTVITAVLCCGPVLRANGGVILSPAPYRWLMALPGFGEIRVPLRFWMLGVMSLSIAGGLAFAALTRRRSRWARGLFLASIAGLALDGGIWTFRLAPIPALWPDVERSERRSPILELPIGGGWDQDWAATYRAAGHRRRVVNGVSGYNPPHYAALVTGLERRDPQILTALASLGQLDVVVNRDADPDRAFERYVSAHPLAVPLADDGRRVAFALRASASDRTIGRAIPIVAARTMRHDADARLLIDGALNTVWADAPQQLDQWVVLDLGATQSIAAVTHALGDFALDFPRRLAIDTSIDGAAWVPAWNGFGAAPAFLALAAQPREGWMAFRFEPRDARYVRLRQLDSAPARWTVAELRAHAPVSNP